MSTVFLFVVSVLLIVVSAEGFTNAVEWAGFRMRLGAGATGSLLAAIGTALPETVVPAVALAARQPSSQAVAIGAILGAPFMLLTVATAVTGVAVLARRPRASVITLDRFQVRRDLGTFALAYTLVLASLALPHALRWFVAVVLVAIYVAYATATVRAGSPSEAIPEPLHLLRWKQSDSPHGAAIGLQLAVSVAALVVGGQLFVTALTESSAALGISALLLALVIVPLATELPEMLNAVLWVRSGDDHLAFGCIAGASAFQACFLGAMGITLTDWAPRGIALIAAPITLASALITLFVLRDGRARGSVLTLAALPWAAWVVVAVLTRSATPV